MAYYTGNYMIYEMLLKAGANPNEVNKFNETPLHLAAKGGFPKCCKALIEHGADTNKLQKKGNSPLHWAVLFRTDNVSPGQTNHLNGKVNSPNQPGNGASSNSNGDDDVQTNTNVDLTCDLSI